MRYHPPLHGAYAKAAKQWALSVKCPTCEVQAGESCKTANGNESYPHRRRVLQAIAITGKAAQ